MAEGNGYGEMPKTINIFDDDGRVKPSTLIEVLESLKDAVVNQSYSIDNLTKQTGEIKKEIVHLDSKLELKTAEIYAYVAPVKRLYRKLIWIGGIAIGFALWLTPMLWDIVKHFLLK
jgi:hypothetical protein